MNAEPGDPDQPEDDGESSRRPGPTAVLRADPSAEGAA